MKHLIQRLACVFLAVWLSACVNLGAVSQEGDYLPGGAQFYSYGVSQSKDNFANIERAQSDYSLYAGERHWVDLTPRRSPFEFNVLQAYYLLHVRWQFKDGREFIAENIDIRNIMREYFKTNKIQLPWQVQKRLMQRISDSDPSLVHEVRNDTVIIKWLIRTNKTPINERFTKTGAAVRWVNEDEEFIVTTIKGKSTSGIDFETRRDTKNKDEPR